MSDERSNAYPDPNNSATGPFYGRGVWELGENGDAGLIVEGHDRRAFAALNAYCRALGIDRPGTWPYRHPVSAAVVPRWVTFRHDCGCTADEHAEHAAKRDAALAEGKARREAGVPVHEAWQPWPDCEELSKRSDCASLPPCQDEFSWMFTRHDDESARPDSALPILEWAS